ncbi:response regulator [Caballeronia sp. dw_276]|uniref:response regulator transcription factor n=1 Tax=Caballeronia sp. dw_276 TaxID=2719795 RepID=UPI00210666C7|nr:response regulator [Caballeronia sp. dw_276]
MNSASEDRQTGSTVYVVDDDDSMRAAVSNLLRSVDLRVEAFASAQEFLDCRKTHLPSCLILDVRLRQESGLALQQDMVRGGVRIPILFMTGHGDIEMSVRAMKAGALDFLTKPFRDQDLLDAVTHALARDAERLAGEQGAADIVRSYASLTPREKQVMTLVVAGLMNKQIAAEMNLSEITVKIHRGQLTKKMGSRSVADLVRKAEALGIRPDVSQKAKSQ